MAILNIIRLRQLVTSIAVILLLSACGESEDGGGGGAAGIKIKAKTLSATSIRLNWSEPDGIISFSPYRVAMEGPMSSSVIASTTALTYTVTNLQPETKYCFVIKMPITGHVASNRACATTSADTVAPSTPSGLAAEATSPIEVDLRWSRSSDNVLVSGYNVYRNGEFLLTTSSSITSDTDVPPGTTPCYAVSAFDKSDNESSRSTEVCVDAPMDVTRPTTPMNVAAAYEGADGQSTMVVSWDASTDDGRVDAYQVFRDGLLISDQVALEYTDVALDANTRYCYTVVAIDSVGNSSETSEPACAREGWTAIMLDSSYVRATALTIDNADRANVAFKAYTFDKTLNEVRHPLTYALIEAGQVTTQDVIDDGTETYFFSDAYRLDMVTDQNNVAHIIHKRNAPPHPEEVRYLQVDGGAVSSSSIEQTTENMTSIALDVDSVGAIHACYALGSRLIYATNATGVWIATDADTLVTGARGSACDIAVDSAGSIHISYLEYSTQDLMYLGNASGDWTLDRIDVDPGTSLSQRHHTSIEVDASGNPHIAYIHGATDNDVEYAAKLSGSWTIVNVNDGGEVGFYCDLALDSRGFAHVVYRAWPSDELMYASNESGAWISDMIDNASTAEMSIAVDSVDNVHMTYLSDTGAIYVTNRE